MSSLDLTGSRFARGFVVLRLTASPYAAPRAMDASDATLALPTPDAFPLFPYDEPYSIQRQLMQTVYSSIEARKVAVVESPTGTVSATSV